MLQPLFLDIYEGDYAHPDYAKVLADPLYFGVILKATEGLGYAPQWFIDNWAAVKTHAGARYGDNFFRGCYLYLKYNLDGKLQADYFLNFVDKAGGWDKLGDIVPVIDCELGNDGTNGGHRDTNNDASAQQIVDCTSACAAQIKSRMGGKVMLYGNGAMRDKGIKSRMGCDYLWFPRYTATLPSDKYINEGWDLSTLSLWQFGGDSVAYLSHYPSHDPLGTHGDISVLVMNGGIPALKSNLLVTK